LVFGHCLLLLVAAFISTCFQRRSPVAGSMT
jgi:hypothetical protein